MHNPPRPGPWQSPGTPHASLPLTTLQGRAIGVQWWTIASVMAAVNYLGVDAIVRRIQ